VLLYRYIHQLHVDTAAAPWLWQQDAVLLLKCWCQCCLQVTCWQLQSVEVFAYCNELPSRLQVNENPLCFSTQVKWHTICHLLLFLLLLPVSWPRCPPHCPCISMPHKLPIRII
jgi:hypothetical protein